MRVYNFEDFLKEDYYANLSKSTADKKKSQIKKQSAMDDDDPEAYKEMPGDTKGKKFLKTSKHTDKYHDLYSDENESVNEKEQKQSTDRSPIDNEAIEKGLKNKSEDTGVPIGILRAVMRRGMAAWKTGHRPGAGQEQWGYARVNSFLTKGKGTWGKADADLAKEVRDGGHDKDLKESSVCEYESLIEKEIYSQLIKFLHEGIKMVKSDSLNESSVDKAQYELSRLLKRAEDKGETPLVKEFVPEIMALVQKFADSGQSGGSAPFTAGVITEVLKKLLAQEPLGGVENSNDEWNDISDIEGVEEGTGTFQNTRLSSVFKEGKEGDPYYLDAIVFVPEGKDYGFTGTASIKEGSEERIGSSQYIKSFPFEPKTFKITVNEKEYRKLEDGSLIEENGGGWWESWIKDPKQLEEVWQHYDKKSVKK
jgi:hypothetical protein